MSHRTASPPPVARWPFVLAAIVLLAIALLVIVTSEGPPGVAAFVIATICSSGGALLLVTPILLEYDARLRLAEAAVRESVEAQLRRLTQTTEQLAHAVSRSQSTEEQAGQALGTLEELTEKLTAQADELAQNLVRANERELAALRADLERVTRERDEKLADLATRLTALTEAGGEAQSAMRKNAAATNRALEELKTSLTALKATPAEPAQAATAQITAPVVAVEPPARDTEPAPPESSRATPPPVAGNGAGEKPAPTAIHPRVKVRRVPETDTAPAQAERARSATLELPFDVPSVQEKATPGAVRRDGSEAVSLVATAYIGIGNKLYVRGDGPGLSWEQGVPMQFLAIGKWGWTTTDASTPVTCRIYRNDDTPMLDENIIIEPGARAEVTPRF